MQKLLTLLIATSIFTRNSKCFILLLISFLLMMSCNEDKPTETTNSAPPAPVLVETLGSPPNGGTSVSRTPTLVWICVDPDGDVLTYDVHFGSISTPPVASSAQSGTSYSPGALEYSTKYYWRVVANDQAGATTSSDTWSFTTMAEPTPSCSVSPTSLDFGDVQVGQSKDLTFTISNTGSVIFGGTVSESCSDYSIVSGGGSYSLSAGQSRTVTVRFTPSLTGTKTCTIETGNSACSNVSCIGNGIMTITVTEPNSSTVWTIGTSAGPILWNTGNLGGAVEVYLLKNGVMQVTIENPSANDGVIDSFHLPDWLPEGIDYQVEVFYSSEFYDRSEYFEVTQSTVSGNTVLWEMWNNAPLEVFDFSSGVASRMPYYCLDSIDSENESLKCIFDSTQGDFMHDDHWLMSFHAQGGFIEIGNVVLEDISSAPEDGYQRYLEYKVGWSYCIKTWDNNFAKIRITGADISQPTSPNWIEFDWIYQPDGSRTF